MFRIRKTLRCGIVPLLVFCAGVLLGNARALHAEALPFAWGLNTYGQLGDGTTTDRLTPVQVTGLSGVTAIGAGYGHCLALSNDGTVWAWGLNDYGQLGDGTTTNRYTPVQVTGLSGVTAIAGQSTHSLALKNDGTVWAWGDNSYGKLGDGTNTNRSTPVQVTGLSGVSAIAIMIGSQHSLALKNDGTVWAWGYNGDGRLGDGTTTGSWTPVQVTGLSGVTAVAGGGSHSLALKNDGTVWAWGTNSYGELGDGTTTDRLTPVQATGLSGATAIAGGYSQSLALKNDGTVWAWGHNGYGEVGDGTTTDRHTPVQATGLSGVTAIAGGNWHPLALKNDGTVWSWGRNTAGQLGDGTTTDRCTPVQVTELSGATAIAGGYYHSLALGTRSAPNITSSLTASGAVGQAFSYDINASGAVPMTFSAQPLPNGLSLSGATISGTPATEGATDVTLGASNSVGSDSKVLRITVNPSGAPTITSTLTVTTNVGTAFSYKIAASGNAPITFNATNLPPGLSFSGDTISGTPSATGKVSVTISASNGLGTDTKTLEITINAAGAPTITSSLSQNARVGQALSYEITATGNGPITFDATPLPGWLTLNGATLSGTPQASDVGITKISVTATNAAGSDSQELSITVAPVVGDPPVITDVLRSRNPVRTNTDVTLTAEAVSPSGQPLTFSWFFFLNGVQEGQPLAGQTITYQFPNEGQYTVVAIAFDGFSKSGNFTKVSVTLAPNSGSTSVNVTTGNQVVNPVSGLGITVSGSMGGVVDIDVVEGTARASDPNETFTTKLPALGDFDGRNTAGKFSLPQIFVVETTGTKVGGATRTGRIMVPVSAGEAGNEIAIVDQRANTGLITFDMKGKFNFGQKLDGVTLKSEIELPAGMSLKESQSISVGIGNVTANGAVDSKGRVTGLSAGNIKKVQVKWPRLDKTNPVTKGGEKARVTITMKGTSLHSAGFDTEGVVNTGLTDKVPVLRDIQTAVVVGGVSYYAQAKVNYTLKKGTGMLAGRSDR